MSPNADAERDRDRESKDDRERDAADQVEDRADAPPSAAIIGSQIGGHAIQIVGVPGDGPTLRQMSELLDEKLDEKLGEFERRLAQKYGREPLGDQGAHPFKGPPPSEPVSEAPVAVSPTDAEDAPRAPSGATTTSAPLPSPAEEEDPAELLAEGFAERVQREADVIDRELARMEFARARDLAHMLGKWLDSAMPRMRSADVERGCDVIIRALLAYARNESPEELASALKEARMWRERAHHDEP